MQQDEVVHPPGEEETTLADVLVLVLQHTKLHHGLKIHDLFSLLQVSNSCQQAVQQSRSKQHVCFDLSPVYEKEKVFNNDKEAHADWKEYQTKVMQGFAEWLPKHAGLVTTLSCYTCSESTCAAAAKEEARLLQRHLALAMKVCRLNAAAAAARGGDVMPAETKPVPLRLEKATFRGSFPEQQLLQELAGAGLQKLEFCNMNVCSTFKQPDSFFAQFAALGSSLRALGFFECKEVVHSQGFLAAVAQLTGLTSLALDVVPADAGCRLPPTLQCLTATFAAVNTGAAVDLSHLADLKQLHLKTFSGGASAVVLPPNPTCMAITCELYAGERLLKNAGDYSLHWADEEHILDTNPAVLPYLCSLPGIQSLKVCTANRRFHGVSDTVAAALRSATGLTSLSLEYMSFTAASGLCGTLATLPRLQDLSVTYCCLSDDWDDWLCLTALTSVTKLTLEGSRMPNDEVAAALARHLTGLCSLSLISDRISSLGLLPVVGALTGLTSLVLAGRQFEVGPDELMLLSSLTQLRDLKMSSVRCGWGERQRFKGGLPHLKNFETAWSEED